MNSISSEVYETTQRKDLIQDVNSHPKALGLHWDELTDSFFVSIGKSTSCSTTKRLTVSDIAWAFDVLGWLAPSTVMMKILFQKLWELHLNWDDEVPLDVQKCHQTWRNEMNEFINFLFPRCYYRLGGNIIHNELHGFADASQQVYAAMVYLQTTYFNLSPSVTLVTAKTKVVPMKILSIPCLELCAASLLEKLLASVRTALKIEIANTHAWSDSAIILYWLDGSPRKFKTFVGS